MQTLIVYDIPNDRIRGKIADACLVGMGAIVMARAVLQPNVVVGAGSVVPGGKVLESGYLYVGSPARRVRELTEQEPFYPGQVFRLTSDQYLALAEIDGQLAHLKDLGCYSSLSGLKTAPDGFNPGYQFVRIERFGQVVIGAKLESLNPVSISPFGGKDNDWNH